MLISDYLEKKRKDEIMQKENTNSADYIIRQNIKREEERVNDIKREKILDTIIFYMFILLLILLSLILIVGIGVVIHKYFL